MNGAFLIKYKIFRLLWAIRESSLVSVNIERSNDLFKGAEGGGEVRGRFEGDRAFLLNHVHDLDERLPGQHH